MRLSIGELLPNSQLRRMMLGAQGGADFVPKCGCSVVRADFLSFPNGSNSLDGHDGHVGV